MPQIRNLTGCYWKAPCALTLLLSPCFVNCYGIELPANTGVTADRVLAATQYASQSGSIRLIAKVHRPQVRAGPPGLLAYQFAESTAAVVSTLSAPQTGVLSANQIDNGLISVTVSPEGVAVVANDQRIEDIFIDQLSDPLLQNSVPAIKADYLHARGVNGNGYAIAILDTGVDSTHPALKGRVVNEACFSTSDATQGSSSLCPAGDSSSTAPGSAMPCSFDVECAHGTHVAGIAASTAGTLNQRPIIGVAPGATIIAVQVFSRLTGENVCGPGVPVCVKSWESDQIRALEYVRALSANKKIAAVNMSLGGGPPHPAPCDSDTMKENIDALLAQGVLTVIAAGNTGAASGLTAPACISSAISVGATNGTSAIATQFSSRAPYMTILAPGQQIHSTWPMALGGGYFVQDGTSMAAPHVAGAVALLRSVNPRASVEALRQALVRATPTLVDPDSHTSFHLLDARVAAANIARSAALPAVANKHAAVAPPSTLESALAQAPDAHVRLLVTTPSVDQKPSDMLTPDEKKLVSQETRLSRTQYSVVAPAKIAEKLKSRMKVQLDTTSTPLVEGPK